MSGILSNLFWFLVLFSIIVLVHEFGHFATAKLLGIWVEVFSLGFGPKLLSFKRKETEYRFSLIPLGGYVKLYGEDKATGDPREFLSRPKWQKLLVLFMGPFMNIVLAVGVMSWVYMAGLQEPAIFSQPVVVGWVAPSSPAAKAGILPGDKIIRLGNKKNPTWRDLRVITSTSAGNPLEIWVKRGERTLRLKIIPEKVGKYDLGYSGIYPPLPPIIGAVVPGKPAARAGLKEGDRFLQVNGIEVKDFYHLRELLQKSQGKVLEIKIERQGKVLTLKVKPEKQGERWILGFLPYQPTVKKKYPPLEALWASIKDNVYYTTMTFHVLGKLIAGKLSPRTLSGPLDIAQFSSATAQAGFIPFLSFLAFVSLQLAIINIIPIPGLDGGQMLILVIEAIIGRELSDKAKDWILKIGFAIIILLSAFAILNDILKRI